MRKTKLLPRKRKLIPKSIVKTARLVRESLEEQEKYLHRIGEHGAVGILVRKGNKVVRVCTECNKEIKE